MAWAAGCSSASTGGQAVSGSPVPATTDLKLTSTPLIKKEAEFKDAEVYGVVRFKGRPLAHATVIFHSEDGSSGTESDADGTFRATAKPGMNKLTVEVKVDRDPKAKKSKLFVAIPERYSQVETTDLSFNLIAGPNQIDIDLK
jgi:hypothetical protein